MRPSRSPAKAIILPPMPARTTAARRCSDDRLEIRDADSEAPDDGRRSDECRTRAGSTKEVRRQSLPLLSSDWLALGPGSSRSQPQSTEHKYRKPALLFPV